MSPKKLQLAYSIGMDKRDVGVTAKVICVEGQKMGNFMSKHYTNQAGIMRSLTFDVVSCNE